MANYKIYFKESVKKDFKPIPKTEAVKILQQINYLAENPYPSGCEKLTDRENYRIRYGLYRIPYSIQERNGDSMVVGRPLAGVARGA